MLVLATGLMAQEPAPAQDAAPADEKPLAYEDYTVKAYTLCGFGGTFSGATYLDNIPFGPRTVLTTGAADIIAYNPNAANANEDGALIVSRDQKRYDAARKEIEPGSAFGARIGIYIADHFHLDMIGTYAEGRAVTTMLFDEFPLIDDNDPIRIEVDQDTGFQVYKGGLALMYDAEPATLFGLEPRLGFGLGGVINRYSYLEDKTALFLEGSLGLSANLTDNLSLLAQLDVTTFAYEVDELGYSNMVTYRTASIGLNWFIDVVSPEARAAHEATLRKR